jgi:hypothetical protein
MSEHHDVEELHGGLGHEPPEQQHGGREEQGLGISRRGVATEMVGVPERQLPMGQGGAQIAQGRVELVLGIPRNDRAGQGPDRDGERPGGQDEAKGDKCLPPRPSDGGGGTLGSENGCLHCFQAASRRLTSSSGAAPQACASRLPGPPGLKPAWRLTALPLYIRCCFFCGSGPLLGRPRSLKRIKTARQWRA